MLSRRIAGGTSPALLIRRFAITPSAASGRPPAFSAGPSRFVSSAPAATSEYRATPHLPPPHTPSPISPLAESLSGSTPTLLEELRLLAAEPNIRRNLGATWQQRKRIWTCYEQLSRAERLQLTGDQLRVILRAVVPRFDEAWRAVDSASPRKRKGMNEKLSERWGRRMRAVISEMVERGIDDRIDWYFILQTMMKVGAVGPVEAVWKSLPPNLQTDREFAELRFGTITRWVKTARLAVEIPPQGEIDIAYRAFWEAFAVFRNPNMKIVPNTNRVLVETTAQFGALMHRVHNREAFIQFSRVLRAVLDNAYGIDLDNIPLSMEKRAEGLGDQSKLRAISPVVLNSVIEHLWLSGVPAVNLLAPFDVMTHEASMPEIKMRERQMDEEEDDDDFAAPTDPDAEDPDRRNWLNRPVKGAQKAAETEFFEPATPPSVLSTPELKQAHEIFFPESVPYDELHPENRRLEEYCPRPIWPMDVVADGSLPIPKRQPYNVATVLLLLRAAASERKWGLVARILEMCVSDTLARDSVWLSAYLANPGAKMARPPRVSPEWFATALGDYTNMADRHAPRTLHVLRRAIAWTDQKLRVILETETRQLAAVGRKTELEITDGRVVLPSPDLPPKKLRFLRNDGMLIPSEEVKRLYDDKRTFEKLLSRNTFTSDRRARFVRDVTARKKQRQEEEEAQLAASSPESDEYAEETWDERPHPRGSRQQA